MASSQPSFNPQPASGLAATCASPRAIGRSKVSTLSQPPGWLQRKRFPGTAELKKFQPSASLRAGCNLVLPILTRCTSWVSTLSQPPGWLQPARWHRCCLADNPVSTLSQPPGWLQRLKYSPKGPITDVSTLSQPPGWLQLDTLADPLSNQLEVSTLSQPPGWLQLAR